MAEENGENRTLSEVRLRGWEQVLWDERTTQKALAVDCPIGTMKKSSQALNQGLRSKGIKGMRSYLAPGETARETTFLRTFLMAAYDLLEYFQTINCI